MIVAIEVGSTNVYADLGHADAAEMQRKSSLAAEIARGIKARHLTQDAASLLLGIDQAKISKITRGQFRGVSEAKLLALVAKLGHDVTIIVGKTKRQGAGKIEVLYMCMRLNGHYGFAKELPHEQRLRDCIGMESADGPREVHHGIIARELLGKEFAPF